MRNDITSPKSSTKLGCKVASVLASIPSGMEGAIPRLWATRHRLDELKASADPVVAYGATTVFMNILPHRLGVALMDSITDKVKEQSSIITFFIIIRIENSIKSYFSTLKKQNIKSPSRAAFLLDEGA